MSASWLGIKSHMANHLLFRKENDFCMTLLSAVGQLTLRWLAKWLTVEALSVTFLQ